MRSIKRYLVLACAVSLAGMLAFSGTGLAERRVCDDGTYPPCRDTGEEGAGNNLSLPAILTDTAVGSIAAYWAPPAPAVLGTHFSYGCDKPQTVGIYSYPNTTCVDDPNAPNVHYDAATCAGPGYPCEGLPVEPIFWQKVADNDWWADQDNIGASKEVAYVDWGDALEARSWTSKSQIRVETQPYSTTIPGFDPLVANCFDAAMAASLDPAVACKVGFRMWHVSGQGITEHWGVRADLSDVSYNYDSPFQIINTDTARLNIAKMEDDSAECPLPGGGEEGEVVILQSEPPVLGAWTGNGWEGACTVRDAPYSIELSVGGKYVYGYNWPMKSTVMDVCDGVWDKTGWWRLTFYTEGGLGGAVQFLDPAAPVHAPPAVVAAPRDLPRTYFISDTSTEVPGESDALYTPVVDTTNNLTYIDLCIVPREQGGGGGGGGPGGGGPGGGGPGGGGPGGGIGGGGSYD
ncbi:MAG: hypothetical protein JSV26_10590 [bacterium]|nr:MAG: hypothetical protein JSV26_10590 [bacterium]